MVREKIYLKRFKWKISPWMKLENINAIWLYCSKGILSFEFEVNPEVKIPIENSQHANYSKNKDLSNFVKITDPLVISSIGKKIKNLRVKGAIGRGVLLGEFELKLDSDKKETKIMSTLLDWQEWNNSNFLK